MAQYEHCLKMNLLPIALWLNWEELSEVMPALSRNWYKLIRLNTSDPFGRKVWMYWGIINENIPKFKTRYSIQYDWKVLRKKVTQYIKDANSQKLQHGSNYTVCNNCGKICCCLKSEWYHAHADTPATAHRATRLDWQDYQPANKVFRNPCFVSVRAPLHVPQVKRK